MHARVAIFKNNFPFESPISLRKRLKIDLTAGENFQHKYLSLLLIYL